MITHYKEYYWKNGKPYGRQIVDPSSIQSFRIIVDPYFKRFSLEKYARGKFEKIIYDSVLLDFRHLTPLHQTAWQKEVIEESEQEQHCILRNQDDRAILVEKTIFMNQRCQVCCLYSIHGLLLSFHQIFYQDWGHPFNGVVFFDTERNPVMIKKYAFDPETDAFSSLLSEEWDMSQKPVIPSELIHNKHLEPFSFTRLLKFKMSHKFEGKFAF